MVTVAQSIDAPIKLTFQSKTGQSILGLGDIIIPGILIAMCLRFDLWRHYNNKITHKPVKLATRYTTETGETVTKYIETTAAVKAPYVDPSGMWGDWLWLRGRPTKGMQEKLYDKTYFYAAMWAYAMGMALTMVVLSIFKQGQPALLYLVPCVVGGIWLTGFVRGETKLLWTYTEDGSLDTEDVVVTTTSSATEKEEASSDSGSTSSSSTSSGTDDGSGADGESNVENADGSAATGTDQKVSDADEVFARESEVLGPDTDDDSDDEQFDAKRDVFFLFSVVKPKRLRRPRRHEASTPEATTGGPEGQG